MKIPKPTQVELKNLTIYELTTVAFIHLKISGDIDWNWFLVLSPWIFRIVIQSIFEVISENRKK